MKVSDVIRSSSDEDMATIISGVILMQLGMDVKTAVKMPHNNVLKVLKQEVETMTVT